MTPLTSRTLAALLAVAAMHPGAASAYDNRVLHVDQHDQENTNWCWNAVSQATLGYYGHPYTQTEIAAWARGGENKANYVNADWTGVPPWEPLPLQDPSLMCAPGAACHGVVQILQHFQYTPVRAPMTVGALTDDEIGRQISDQLRPIVIRWAWDTGGGHFVLATGVQWDSSNTEFMYFMDSWSGPMYGTAAWVRRGSYHTWTTTVTVEAPAPPPVANVDGCGVLPWGHGLAMGQHLRSCNGRYDLTMGSDGDLWLLPPTGGPLWRTFTGRGGYAMLTAAGQLVVYEVGSSADTPVYSSTPPATPVKGRLVVSDTGHLYIEDSSSNLVKWLY